MSYLLQLWFDFTMQIQVQAPQISPNTTNAMDVWSVRIDEETRLNTAFVHQRGIRSSWTGKSLERTQVAPCGSVCVYMCVTGSSSVRWRSLHKAYSGHGQTDRDGWRMRADEELEVKTGHDARGCHQENPFLPGNKLNLYHSLPKVGNDVSPLSFVLICLDLKKHKNV